MKKLIALVVAGLLAGCSPDKSPDVSPTTPPGRLTPTEQAKIKTLNLRLGGDANYPPFVFKGPDGKLEGLAVDYFADMAKRMGIKYEVTFIGQRADMLQQLKNKQIDVTYASRTASTRPYLIVTQPYEYSKGTLLVMKGFDPKDIQTVGAGRGYASVTWLKENKPQYEVVEYEDDEDCIHHLMAQKVDSCIMGREIALYFFDKLHVSPAGFDMTPVEYNYFLSFGVNTDNPELVSILMKGMELMPYSRRQELVKKWLKDPESN